MAGIKRSSQDDQYTPRGLQSSSKRSRSSLVEPRSPYTYIPTPVKQRPLQQRSGSVLDYLPTWLRGYLRPSSESVSRKPHLYLVARSAEDVKDTPSPRKRLSSYMASPSTNRSSRRRGDSRAEGNRLMTQPRRLSITNGQEQSPLARPDDNKVIDVTREADEQSQYDDDADAIALAGPSRHTIPHNRMRERSSSKSSDIQYLGSAPAIGHGLSRTTPHGEPLAGQPRRRERNRMWESGVHDIIEIEDEHVEQQGRARRQTGQKDSTIPLMEEQLALFRHKEFQAEQAGDVDAIHEAKRTVLHFERAIKAARADQEAKKQQAKPILSTLADPNSLISYEARVAALTGQRSKGPGSLFGAHRVEPSILNRVRQPIPPKIQPSPDIEDLIKRLDLENKIRDEEYLKTQKPTIPNKLSAEEASIVNRTLSDRSFKSPSIGGEIVEARNIPRLQDGKWLADDIITYYLALVNIRNTSNSKLPKIHCFNTFFFTKIESGGQKAVRRWTKKVDIFSKDFCLVPINIGDMHWIAAAINFKQKRIEYFDSLGAKGGYGGMGHVCDTLHQYILDEHLDKKGSPYDMSDWKHVSSSNAPQQTNGSDCGVFSVQTLELVARGADPIDKGFEFTPGNMPYFRKLMILEITQGKLKERW